MKTLKFLAIVFVLCFSLAPVRAELITIDLTAVVDSVYDEYNLLENKIHAGDTITGFYTYDSSALDLDPDLPDLGRYKFSTSPSGMSLTVGGLTFQTNQANIDFLIGVENNLGGDLHDYYGVTSYSNLQVGDGVSVNRLFWHLDEYSGTAISADTLPLIPPDLLKWQDNILSIDGGQYSNPRKCEDPTFVIYSHVTDVYLVPEPVSLCLLAFGGLLMRRNCKK